MGQEVEEVPRSICWKVLERLCELKGSWRGSMGPEQDQAPTGGWAGQMVPILCTHHCSRWKLPERSIQLASLGHMTRLAAWGRGWTEPSLVSVAQAILSCGKEVALRQPQKTNFRVGCCGRVSSCRAAYLPTRSSQDQVCPVCPGQLSTSALSGGSRFQLATWKPK